MSLREHLRHLVSHAEWWAVEWLYHHYREVLGVVMLAILGAIVQRVQGVPCDWWVLGILFFGPLGFMAYSHVRDRRESRTVVLPVEETQSQIDLLPLQISSQDAANREKITVLFRAYGVLASVELQQMARKLLAQFRNFRSGDTRARDEGDEIIAQLVHNGPYGALSQADSQLHKAINDPDKVEGSELQYLLEEFFLAYQDLIRWVIRLDYYHLSLVTESKEPVSMFRSVLEGRDFLSWQERHKLFHQKLRELLALDDFSKSQERLSAYWKDIFV